MACSPIDSLSSTNDHLLLRWHLNLPPGVFVKNDLYCHRRWKLVQYLPGVFSRRWFSYYLFNLQGRQKWIRPRHSFAVGNLVLIPDERVHPSRRPLGHVLEGHPGRDGFIRSDGPILKVNLRGWNVATRI